MLVTLVCKTCNAAFQKKQSYVKGRQRQGKHDFFCSRKCASANHSINMRGSGNPNFNGKFHGQTPDMWPEEKRRLAAKKVSETMIARGTSKGSNNGRWAGGHKDVNCAVCGKPKKVRPYVYRQIQAGERAACCDNDCARIYGLTQIKREGTSIEIKMAAELDASSIKYIDQFNLGNKFALDFFLPEYGIVIECDGDYWHRLPDVAKRDKSKNAYIKACGYTLFRFWESEINEDVSACVAQVIAKIDEIKSAS